MNGASNDGHRMTSLPGRDALRAAVVGAGTGGMLSIRALQSSGRYDLVGVADVSETARRRAADLGVTAEMFADAGRLLEAVEPEVVCVSTFASSHAELVVQALDAGVRGVLLEKPVALDWASGRATLDRLRDRRVPVVVPHGLLVRPASEAVLRHISEGVLGDLELIEVECRRLGLAKRRGSLGGFCSRGPRGRSRAEGPGRM